MNRLFIVGLLLLFLACSNGDQKKNSTAATNGEDSLLRVLTYGISQSQGGAAGGFVAKQFGFCYYSVTGCVLTKQLSDSIERENNKVYQTLAQQYGSNWKQEYNKKVDSLSALFLQVKEVVSHQPLLQQANHQHNNSFFYRIIPTDTANFFDVQAFSADSNDASYKLKVNLTTHQVELVK